MPIVGDWDAQNASVLTWTSFSDRQRRRRKIDYKRVIEIISTKNITQEIAIRAINDAIKTYKEGKYWNYNSDGKLPHLTNDLLEAFSWDYSTEGHDFWYRIRTAPTCRRYSP